MCLDKIFFCLSLYSKFVSADSCKMLLVELFNTVHVAVKIADYICGY